jgi:hypothetical protein
MSKTYLMMNRNVSMRFKAVMMGNKMLLTMNWKHKDRKRNNYTAVLLNKIRNLTKIKNYLFLINLKIKSTLIYKKSLQSPNPRKDSSSNPRTTYPPYKDSKTT